MIDRCPEPDFVFLADKRLQLIEFPHLRDKFGVIPQVATI